MPSLLEPQGTADRGRVILETGEAAEIRPLGPGDGPALDRLVRRQPAHALTERFLAASRPEAAARALWTASEDAGVSLVVTAARAGHEPDLVAVGSLSGPDGDDAAELAVLVDDAWRGRGAGTVLIERLALIAMSRGQRRLTAFVGAGNRDMLEVLASVGFPCKVETVAGSPDVRVDLDIEHVGPAARRFAQRDRIATVASLASLFRPRTVAVVGASRTPSSVGRRVFDNLLRQGYTGALYPVNPHASSIGDRKAFATVDDLPDGVDMCVVCVPAAEVEGVIEAAGRRRIAVAVVISAGFSETGAEGRARQERVLAAARRAGVRLVGPNCLGLVNTAPDMRMNASFAPHMPPEGRIAMASQSGALGMVMLEYAREQGLGISTFVSVGNKADVSGNDLLQYWEQDPATGVIVLYLESFGNPRRFARLARRVGRQKPILLVKAARTAAGGRAAASHTAALMTSDTAVSALVSQTGIVRADTLEELFEAASLLARQPLPTGPRVAIVTNAGGPGILAADALAVAGMQTPPPGPATRATLAEALPSAASLGNPVDMIASAGPEHYRAVLRQMLADEAYDAVLVIFIPVELVDSDAVMRAIREETERAQASGRSVPVAACVMGGSAGSDPGRDGAVPLYRFPESAARALAAAYRYGRFRQGDDGGFPDLPGLDLGRARRVIGRSLAKGEGWMESGDVFELLDSLGIATIAPRLAPDAEAAGRIAEETGRPVAVKLASRTVTHKGDVGGVRLGLRGADAVAGACRDIAEGLRRKGITDALDGFLVQAMAPSGVECLVGVSSDPSFGPVLAFGLGGSEVEALNDLTFGLPPLTDRDAMRMVEGIRAHGLLEGFRGRPPADRAALADTLMRISVLVDRAAEVEEMDLNPIIALPDGEGVRVVDARIRLRSRPAD